MSTANPTNHWKLGLFVTLGFLAGLLVLAWLGASRLDREAIEAHTFFDEPVNGLEVGSPVKFRGVTIGKVLAIRAASDRRRVNVRSEIYIESLEQIGLSRDQQPKSPQEGAFVPDDLRMQLVTQALTGVAFVQLDFFDPEVYPVPEYPFTVPWNTIHGVRSTFETMEQGVVQLAARFPALADDLSRTLIHVDTTLTELELGALSQDARSLMAAAERRINEFDEIPVVANANATLVEAEQTLASMRELLERLDEGDGSLENLLAKYASVGEQMEAILEQSDLPETARSVRTLGKNVSTAAGEFALLSHDLRQDLASLDRTLESFERLADLLERDPGALIHGKTTSSTSPWEGR